MKTNKNNNYPKGQKEMMSIEMIMLMIYLKEI